MQCSVFGMNFGLLNHGNKLSKLFGIYLTPTDLCFLRFFSFKILLICVVVFGKLQKISVFV